MISIEKNYASETRNEREREIEREKGKRKKKEKKLARTKQTNVIMNRGNRLAAKLATAARLTLVDPPAVY